MIIREAEWTNWVGSERSFSEIITPRTREDLQRAVREAAASGKRIRPTGGSYSWAPLVPTNGVILEMHHLNRVLAFDHEAETIDIECGMTIEQLNEKVTKEGFTLVSPTLFPKPTVGGAIAPGCHGTGTLTGNFTDEIVEMTIVTADGSLEKISHSHPEFGAAQVALGTLGIVYSVRLNIQKQYNVRLEKRLLPVKEVLEGFEDLRHSAEFIELFWFPFQDKMWVYLMNKTPDPPDAMTLSRRLKSWFSPFFENTVAGIALPWIAKYMPQLTPLVAWSANRMSNSEGVTVDIASKIFHFQKAYPKCWDLSYAFPAEQAGLAWQEGIDLVNRYREAGLYPVNLALHGRFTGSSKAWIAPDHGRETAYVEVTTIEDTPHYQEIFEEIESRWFAIPGARPHWAKVYKRADQIRERYHLMDRFLEVRERWDPQRTFLNSFLEETVFKLDRPTAHEAKALPTRAESDGRTAPATPPAA